MPESPRMAWPYPAEREKPYYESFENLVRGLDASGYAAREDRHIILSGGGPIEWDADTGMLSLGGTLRISAPITGFLWTVPPGTIGPISDGQVLRVTLARAPLQVTQVAVTIGNTVASTDNDLVLAVRIGTTVYWRNGLAHFAATTVPDVAITSGDAIGVEVLDAFSVKPPVTVVATENVPLAALVPTAVVNGVTLVAGHRVLLPAQNDGAEDGIYVVSASGPPSRASDLAEGLSVSGVAVVAQMGTLGAGFWWICRNAPGSDVVGTHDLNWQRPCCEDEVTGDVEAVNVTFQPTATLTSDNVQDAVEEVDGKAVANAVSVSALGGTVSGLGSTVGGHTATLTAVGSLAPTYYTPAAATPVGQLQGIDTRLGQLGAGAVQATGALVHPSNNETGYIYEVTVNKAAGDYTAFGVNVVETSAPGSDNKVFELSVGGVPRLSVASDGVVTVFNDGVATSPSLVIDRGSGGPTGISAPSNNVLQLAANEKTVVLDGDGSNHVFRPEINASLSVGSPTYQVLATHQRGAYVYDVDDANTYSLVSGGILYEAVPGNGFSILPAGVPVGQAGVPVRIKAGDGGDADGATAPSGEDLRLEAGNGGDGDNTDAGGSGGNVILAGGQPGFDDGGGTGDAGIVIVDSHTLQVGTGTTGDKAISIYQSETSATGEAGIAKVYAKEVTGVAHLFARGGSGDEVQLTGAASGGGPTAPIILDADSEDSWEISDAEISGGVHGRIFRITGDYYYHTELVIRAAAPGSVAFVEVIGYVYVALIAGASPVTTLAFGVPPGGYSPGGDVQPSIGLPRGLGIVWGPSGSPQPVVVYGAD